MLIHYIIKRSGNPVHSRSISSFVKQISQKPQRVFTWPSFVELSAHRHCVLTKDYSHKHIQKYYLPQDTSRSKLQGQLALRQNLCTYTYARIFSIASLNSAYRRKRHLLCHVIESRIGWCGSSLVRRIVTRVGVVTSPLIKGTYLVEKFQCLLSVHLSVSQCQFHIFFLKRQNTQFDRCANKNKTDGNTRFPTLNPKSQR